jgi:pyruvate kinase
MPARTKIVCTIGPASTNQATIEALISAGMNVARLNMSHGNHEEHRTRFSLIRSAAKKLGANVAILADLQGPKIRTGPLREGRMVTLVEGSEFTITTEEIEGDARRVGTTYKRLPQDVRVGNRILLADGLLELRVDRVSPPEVLCEVVRGGVLGEHKGINLPGVHIAEPSLSEKDREDLAFCLGLGVDYVALSFVRHPEDVRALRELISRLGGGVGIVAKIERPEALEGMEEICQLSDAIMVARGDLGVEVDYEQVPILQKRIIATCNELGVPVITATQMLESMMNHVRPTRAEAADVANAIYDGTDAVMLSGETALGNYPVEACMAMARIAAAIDAEQQTNPVLEHRARRRTRRKDDQKKMDGQGAYADAIGQAVCRMVDTLNIANIVCFTTTGYTARAIARYRPACKIIAITNTQETMRKCALYWGVSAIQSEDFHAIGAMVRRVEELLLSHRLAARGDTIVIAAGTPLVLGGRTNLLKLHTLGDAIE